MDQQPSNSELAQMFAMARECHRTGKLGQAEHLYRQILHRDGSHAGAMHLLGLLAMQAKQFDAAEDLIRRAIAMDPNAADPHTNLGNILVQRGRHEEAIEEYRAALKLKPLSAEAHNNLGNALRAVGKAQESIAHFNKAIELVPNYVGGYNNLGGTLRMLGRFDEAVAAYQKALAIDPKSPDVHSNLGCAFQDLGKLEEALKEFEVAIGLRKDFYKARASMGITLTDLGRVDEAIEEYRRAVGFAPEVAEAASNLLMTLHYSPKAEAREIFKEHRLWGQRHADPLSRGAAPHENDPDPDRRLRIGYVSPDFRGHPVSYFFEPILEQHDRERFEIACYSDVMTADQTTERLKAMADQWRDLKRGPHEQAAESIRRDRIDILVDLAGHTDSNRLLAFARKPVPIQVTYLGYPDTTGMAAMDYRLTDALADPPGQSDSLHSERVLRLPGCAWCYRAPEDAPEVGPLLAKTSGSVTFGSFNVLAKINDEVLELWAQILRAVPGSKLLIKNKAITYEAVAQRVRGVLERHGIEAGRVELRASDPSIREHLQMYNRVDIALDTFPYNGTTTTCEALHMGVPVVALAGSTHASRVGVSLLGNVGLSELVASSKERYVQIAAELAKDLPRLETLRSTMRQRLVQSPLTDARRFTRELETIYRDVWRKWCHEVRGKS